MGLILLVIPILVSFLLYLIFGIINIRMNKKNNLSSIKKLSIIEICVACGLGLISFGFCFVLFLPNLIISIIRLIMLSEIKKDSREES